MNALADPYSAQIVNSILSLCVSEFQASFAMIFWYDDDLGLRSTDTLAMPEELLPFYAQHVTHNDPLNIRALAETRSRMASLRGLSDVSEDDFVPAYRAFLDKFQINDELDMVFWHEERPVGGLALFRDATKNCFHLEDRNWKLIHDHVGCTLQAHTRFRDLKLQRLLKNSYGLSCTESRVVEIMMTGATNLEIAEALGLKLSTVKSYVFNIFNKIGVDSRASLIASLATATFK